AVEDELAEETEADLARHAHVTLPGIVNDVDLIAHLVARDVDVLAQLDVTLRAENHRAAIAPRAEAVRRVPVDTNIVRRAVVAEQRRFAEILERRLVGVREGSHRGLGHRLSG